MEDFILLAKRHTDSAGRSRCPCRRCQNTLFRPMQEVVHHLFMHGMYCQPRRNDRTEPNVGGNKADGEDRNVKLLGNVQIGTFTNPEPVENPPIVDLEGGSFDRLLNAAQRELQPSCEENNSKIKFLHCAGSKSNAKRHSELKTADLIVEHDYEGQERAHKIPRTGLIQDEARKASDDKEAESSEASANMNASTPVPVEKVILENCLKPATGICNCGSGYGKKKPSSSSGHRRKSNADVEYERRVERVEQKHSEIMESLKKLKEGLDLVLENQRKSMQLMSTNDGAYRLPSGNPQLVFGAGPYPYPYPYPYPPVHFQPPKHK